MAFNMRANDSGLNVAEATGAAGPMQPQDFAIIQPLWAPSKACMLGGSCLVASPAAYAVQILE